METKINHREDVTVATKMQIPSIVGRWAEGAIGKGDSSANGPNRNARRAGDDFDYAYWRATSHMPQLAAANELAEAPSELCYVTPSVLHRTDLAEPLLTAYGSSSYVSLSMSHVGRRLAGNWARRAGWLELDYDSLVQLTGRKGSVVQRMCRLWDPANHGLVVLDSPLGALTYAGGVWAHSRPFDVNVSPHRPTFAAHFLARLSVGASLSDALEHAHAAGIAHNLGVEWRTPADLQAWAAAAPRCFPQTSNGMPRWIPHLTGRTSELAVAASIGAFVAWLAERCYEW